jgi:hypothetical protein
MEDLTYTINYCTECGEVEYADGCSCYWPSLRDEYPYEEYSQVCQICKQTEDFCSCHRYDEEHFYEDMNG